MAGTSRLTKIIRLRVPNQRLSQVKDLAEKKGLNLSELLRHWIDLGYHSEALEANASQNEH